MMDILCEESVHLRIIHRNPFILFYNVSNAWDFNNESNKRKNHLPFVASKYRNDRSGGIGNRGAHTKIKRPNQLWTFPWWTLLARRFNGRHLDRDKWLRTICWEIWSKLSHCDRVTMWRGKDPNSAVVGIAERVKSRFSLLSLTTISSLRRLFVTIDKTRNDFLPHHTSWLSQGPTANMRSRVKYCSPNHYSGRDVSGMVPQTVPRGGWAGEEEEGVILAKNYSKSILNVPLWSESK